MAALSEHTALLPQRQSDSNVNTTTMRIGNRWRWLLTGLVGATVLGFLGTRVATDFRPRIQVGKSPETVKLTSTIIYDNSDATRDAIDQRLALWGEWRRDASLLPPHWQQEASSKASNAWEQTQETIESTYNITRDKSSALAHDASATTHDLWSRRQTWWGKAAATEDEWWNHTQSQLAIFGTRVRSWWKTTEDDAASQEQNLANHFQQWWKVASDTERTWWNHTTDAFGRFMHSAADKEHLWWEATRRGVESAAQSTGHALKSGWNATRNFATGGWEHTKEGWNATENVVEQGWNHTKGATEQGWNATEGTVSEGWKGAKEKTAEGWNGTKESVEHGWSATRDAVVGGWNATANAVEGGWDATKEKASQAWKSSRDAEDSWWNATRRWFHHEALKDEPVNEQSALPPPALVYLNTTRSYNMLLNGYAWYDYSKDFFHYQQGWDVQKNQAYCGVASAAAVLNSLRSDVKLSATDPSFSPYLYATQESILEPKCVSRRVVMHNDTVDGILRMPGGLSLEQVKSLLECNLASDTIVEAVHVDPDTIKMEDVRETFKTALRDPKARVLVNYDRHVLGQSNETSAGHFSPLASYSERDDTFLILDVAKYKFPPVWVPTAGLFRAMSTTDACGDFDYPISLGKLPAALPKTREEYLTMLKDIDCRPTFRGYVFVKGVE